MGFDLHRQPYTQSINELIDGNFPYFLNTGNENRDIARLKCTTWLILFSDTAYEIIVNGIHHITKHHKCHNNDPNIVFMSHGQPLT